MQKKLQPKVSIIICVYKIGERFYQDIKKYTKLRYSNYEIIWVTEKKFVPKEIPTKVRIIKAKKSPISLGEKRDIGFKAAKGEFCAYIDDDAYPNAYWLTYAVKLFQGNKKIGAVGGPNLTPPDDTFWEQVGGYTYESYFTSGEAQYRFLPRPRRMVLELQGVNMIIRKNVLKKIGGFKSRLNSGDDSKVCSNIRALGYDIVYDPNVQVYHHRRSFPGQHLRQIRNMGMHRGFFVKAYPATLDGIYFLPLLLLTGLLGGVILSIFSFPIRVLFWVCFLLFFFTAYLSVFQRAGWKKGFFVVIGIIATHLTYAIFFIRGLFLKKIEK